MSQKKFVFIMEYIRTTKGSVQLHRDGYLYYKNKSSNNDNTFWGCVNRRRGEGCKAKILINENGELIREHREHTHEPDPEKVLITRARVCMKSAANETAEKTQNIDCKFRWTGRRSTSEDAI